MAWQLTAAAFDRLLTALDGDRERAALAYEQLRLRTIGLLQWWGAVEVEGLADEILDRVARKLEDGTVVPSGSLGAYVRGVARMVYYESVRHARALAAVHQPVALDGPDPSEASHACLERCLDALDVDERQLVLRYYGDGSRPDVRRRLAAETGVSITALRIRTHRLRERLERCVTVCLAG